VSLGSMLEIKIFAKNKITKGVRTDLADSSKTAWGSVTNPKPADWDELNAITKLDSKDVKEFLQANTRPRLSDLHEYAAILFRSPSLSGKTIVTKPNLFLVSEQKRQIFTITRGGLPAEEVINAQNGTRLETFFAEGPTTLLYHLLEEIIDAYRKVLEHVGEEVEKIEVAVLQKSSNSNVTSQIFRLRKTLVYIVRALFANQEVVSAIEKSHSRYLNEKIEPRFRTLYEDIEQMEDLASIYRELLASSLDVHLSEVSNSLNIVMKRLTSLAAIVLVPTLIAGIYGMNFVWLPFAGSKGGFFVIGGIMLVSVIILYVYFKKRDWL